MKRAWVLLLLAACWGAGCGPAQTEFVTEPRLQQGLVVILPGIEGEGINSDNVRRGLDEGGVGGGLLVYPWGRPIPLAGVLVNQMDFLGNRLVAGQIADRIAQYQDAYPGRPVHLVGHSGGGGVAVFTAEALGKMPGERKVDGLVLLSASISKVYDLTAALKSCRKGIINYYSERDVALLGVGTTLFGNVDGIHGPAAGTAGFDKAPPGLYQVPWQEDMAAYGNNGGHMDSCEARFVQAYVARWVLSPSWPGR